MSGAPEIVVGKYKIAVAGPRSTANGAKHPIASPGTVDRIEIVSSGASAVYASEKAIEAGIVSVGHIWSVGVAVVDLLDIAVLEVFVVYK